EAGTWAAVAAKAAADLSRTGEPPSSEHAAALRAAGRFLRLDHLSDLTHQPPAADGRRRWSAGAARPQSHSDRGLDHTTSRRHCRPREADRTVLADRSKL